MFGLGLWEVVLIVIVAIVVIGPKDLPKVLRKLGQWSGKLRRMAADLRAQSGIDDVLRHEGLTEDINEIRKLARGEIDTVARSMRLDEAPPAQARASDGLDVERSREYPREGADSYGALPDTSLVYAGTFPKSRHASDPLYVLGDADGVIPADPTPGPDPSPNPSPTPNPSPDPSPSPSPSPNPLP